jgi:diguanylate cyclase (GGDEF)-like protein
MAEEPLGRPVASDMDEGAAWTGWGRSAQPLPRGIGAGVEALLGRQSRALLWTEAFVLVGLFAVLDYVTGTEINFAVFYLVPVMFATWFISRRAGVLVSLLSTAVWAYLDALGRVPASSVFIPVWNGLVRLVFFLIVMQLVHIMRESRIREAELAHTDSLTGVANGRSFSNRAALELAVVRRSGMPLTMAYIDLDHFKRVNDTVGHTEGDRLLRAVAQVLRLRLRETDLVARLGGDEFGVLLPNTDAVSAPDVLDSMVLAIDDAVDGSWDVGCTIGAVTFEKAPESVDFMVRTADELMYRGKRAGRGRVEHAVWPGPELAGSPAAALPTC